MSSWIRVSHQLFCPICGRPDWCQISEDGEVVMCMRVSSDRSGQNARGETYWLHRQGDGPIHIPGELRRADHGVDDRAPVEERDAVYRLLFNQLSLRAVHRTAMRRRGLPDGRINELGYRSWPFFDARKDICSRMENLLEGAGKVGIDLQKVPGFFVNEEGHLSLAGQSRAMAIPCRDPEERIVGVQLRHDEPGDGPKYVFLSSWKHGGPKSGYLTHCPLFEGPVEEVRLTEGFLKADIATALGGCLCVGLPNCSSFRGALEVLPELGVRRVIFALDADVWTNPLVAMGLFKGVVAMDSAGLEVAVEQWPSALGKGIDDVLGAGHGERIVRVAGVAMYDLLKQICSKLSVLPPYELSEKFRSVFSVS